MNELYRPIDIYRDGLTAEQLAYDDVSPIVEPVVDVMSLFDQYIIRRFKVTTDDKQLGVFPEAEDVQVGERYAFTDFSIFDDDPGFDTSADTKKIIKGDIVIEEGFGSLQACKNGRIAWKIRLDDEIPRFRFAVPHGFGVLHESVVDGAVSTSMFVDITRSAENRVWVAIAQCSIAFRLHIQKDRYRLHDYPLPECGEQRPYSADNWNRSL